VPIVRKVLLGVDAAPHRPIDTPRPSRALPLV